MHTSQQIASASLFSLPPAVAPIFDAATRDPRWAIGKGQSWWWLWLPVLTVAGVLAVHAVDQEFYRAWILPEGYGFLEVTQFVEAFLVFVLCLWLVRKPVVADWPLLRRILYLFAAASLYIAGEEMSWGQHWFGWGTPESWSEINRQDETNLHNTSYVFNQLPQLILEIGILTSGVILPLVSRITGGFRHWILVLFTPTFHLLPTALTVFALKGLSSLQKQGIGRDLLGRPSETMETIYYMFILFYLVVLMRRIMLLDELRAR